MSSQSVMDFFTDKLFSYSSKMKGDSSRLTGSLNFMSDNNKLLPLNLLNGLLRDSSINSETSNLIVPMKQSFGFDSGNNSFSFLHSFQTFTPILNALMVDPYHFSHSSETFISPEKVFISPKINNVCMSRLTDMKPNLDSGLNCKEMSLPSVNPDTKVSLNLSLTKMKDKVTSKCDLSNFSTLNIELKNRKTKEMNKRSRNRRRRRKKNQPDCNKAASMNNMINKEDSCITNLYLVSENPMFECTVSVSHPLQLSSSVISTFIIPVDGASDDDSEWESYDMNQTDALSSESGGKNVPSSVSSHAKSENVKSKSPQPSDCNFFKAASLKSSFYVPVGSSDDESDLDSSSADLLQDLTEFQFTGLFVTNFCSPKTVSSKPEESNAQTEDEETIETKAHLREANKKWDDYTEEMNEDIKPKSQKVSFASDEVLVEVFPADMYERKGEWERYATERLRFKRKIDELQKVISPCLDPKHRLKIFKRLNKSVL